MTIEAKIICDSIGPNGVRLTTFILKYPRFIHSEFMTHRAFSRNASSSRAIPIERQIKLIREDPAIPLEFRKNQKGMQAGQALDPVEQDKAKTFWLGSMYEAIRQANELIDLGVHKQYVNRLLEPFAHITVVVTATEYANFFALRHHYMAQPEIAELAKQMWELYKTNTPKTLLNSEWHLPFIIDRDISYEIVRQFGTSSNMHDYSTKNPDFDWLPLIKMSVARCARVSYLNHEGKNSTQEEDFKLYDRLLGSQPIHASPAEHQAAALPEFMGYSWSGNLKGWRQYRKILPNENITEFSGPLDTDLK